jgi:hypothetical protein
MNIVIVGNCQARPLKDIIETISSTVKVISTPIVHLLKDEDEHSVAADLERADLIITQLIADNYPCRFIQTNILKINYPAKVLTILNLFYSGYTPDWMYVRIPSKGTLKGPMGDYHNSTIIESWLNNRTVSETADLLFDKEYNFTRYNAAVIASMDELALREQHVDVNIVDFISNNLSKTRLFFTFNHPCLALLIEYAKRILEKMNISPDNEENIVRMIEPLNQFIPPLNPGVDFDFPIIKEFKGQEVTSINGNEIITSGKKIYSPDEIVLLYFSIYEQNEVIIRDKYGS